jgi:sugar phosphate permease
MAALHLDLCRVFNLVSTDYIHSINCCVRYYVIIKKSSNWCLRSQGFDRITANAISAVGATSALLVVFLVAYLSDRTNKRGLVVIIAQTCYLVALIAARRLQPHVGKWSKWGLWTLVNAFAVGYHPSHNSWLQLNCQDSRERSIAVA